MIYLTSARNHLVIASPSLHSCVRVRNITKLQWKGGVEGKKCAIMFLVIYIKRRNLIQDYRFHFSSRTNIIYYSYVVVHDTMLCDCHGD